MASYWFVIIASICAWAFLKYLVSSKNNVADRSRLPPGPVSLPVITELQWFRKSFSEIKSLGRAIKARYGPIVSVTIASRPFVFIGSHSLAHRALVQKGAIFSDRPKPSYTDNIFSSNQRNISSAAYGPTWRLLRQNLTSQILHPTRLKSFSGARRWALGILVHRLRNQVDSDGAVMGHFVLALCHLLSLMCFGHELEDHQIGEIDGLILGKAAARRSFKMLNILPPKLGRVLFRKQWKKMMQLRVDQDNLLLPLIKSRLQQKSREFGDVKMVAYVDTLVGLQLPDEKRNLNEEEIVTLCSEFLNAGTHTTTTALQWIVAYLVKHPAIQEKLHRHIATVVGTSAPEVKEEDLQKIPYLKAVVLEGLRRRPPLHFVLPHAVAEEAVLGDFKVPKNAEVNFMVADIGWDAEVWEDPMEFRPERFLSAGGNVEFDVTGNKEIKMMPFGAGRRICPGFGLALLHLEYFVANLIWVFEWKPVDGDDVDLTEEHVLTVDMKYPLRASISPRVPA